MPLNSQNVLRLIQMGAQVEIDAFERNTDNIIMLAQAVAAQGRTPKVLNVGSKSTANLVRIHEALNGNVILSGV